MCIIKDISELSQYLSSHSINSQNTTRFFRGHSDINFKLVPSIYREPFARVNEDRIIKDALISCPDYFSASKSIFNRLVILQHYGYKTRLLDITLNALVALFFAVQENKDKDGEFIIFDIPSESIKYPSSDTVSVLSAISLRNHSFSIIHAINQAKNKGLVDLADFMTREKDRLKFLEEEIQNPSSVMSDYDITPEMIKKGITLETRSILQKGENIGFNENPDIIKLVHDIRFDMPGFEAKIEYRDFNQVLCVRAEFNNPRIIRQQGAFLLFGMQENSKLNPAEINKDWVAHKIRIPKEYKSHILEELRVFGISRQTLFPELEAQSKDIIEKYKAS